MEFITSTNGIRVEYEDIDTAESKAVLTTAMDMVRLLVILSQRTEGIEIPTKYAKKVTGGR